MKSGQEAADRKPPSLFELSGAVVSSAMGHLEREVWALPGPILQGILPLLNVYYLERIEETAVKKGLSTQPIWCKLWFNIMKTRPSRLESIKCWRKKFLETFFSNVLRGTLDVSSYPQLNDPSFLPLLHTSRHVTQLTVYNMLEGVSELMAKHNRKVLENLATSLRSLTFRHLLSCSLSTKQQLRLFLHRLIHHGAVSHLSMYSWPEPDPVLLALILKLSAGIWHPHKTLRSQENLCHLCREKSLDQTQKLDQGNHPALASNQLVHRSSAAQCSDRNVRNKKILPTVPQKSVSGFEGGAESTESGTETLKHPVDCRLSNNSETYDEGGSSSFSPAKASQDSPTLGTTQKRCKTERTTKHSCPQRTSEADTESEDLYDFVFAIAREEKDKLQYSKRRNTGRGMSPASCFSPPSDAASSTNMVCTEKVHPVGLISPNTTGHFHCVSTLEIFSISLTRNTCQMLGNLLSSWVSLEKLVLSLNGLGPGIFSILSGLRSLSHHDNYCLRVVRISDMFSHVPCMNLVQSILSAVPLLQTLLVSFDLKASADCNRPDESLGSLPLEEEIPESHLEQLEIRFPREPLQTRLLVPVLKASRSLQSLSLDSVAISCPQEVGLLLHALKEHSPNLKKLSFHDVNLSCHSEEVLSLLQDPILQEITFSFCRLFENCTAELLSEIINVVKKNSSLKSLKLPGNRLGNHRLVALADIFAEDSLSSICHLDVSSNCIKPDGLLEFAKKLESYAAQRGEQIKFTKLCLYQNWLDQDIVTTQEALWRLKAMCNIVSDTWDSSQAFADYISVM
uniref:Leucine-rich repeat-containing protein 41 n=1 Tax=Salvator merianae TaxID=96440 RepID=A0A8D0DXY6_SALMN